MNKLTTRRIARLLATCKTPALAGAACERVYRLSQRLSMRLEGAQANAMLDLSSALAEHRHVLLAQGRQDDGAAAEHAESRTEFVIAAVRAAARAA